MKFLFVVIALVAHCSDRLNAQTDERIAVRTSFDNYKTAVLQGNGAEAVQYLDARTLSYYSYIAQITRSADSITIEKLPLLDKLILFSLRHRSTREDIVSFTGESLLVYAIEKGMVGKNAVTNNLIGAVEIDGGHAIGHFERDGETSGLTIDFYRESSGWKIDITSLFPISTDALKGMQTESGETESSYIFMLLELMTGIAPTNAIFSPVIN